MPVHQQQDRQGSSRWRALLCVTIHERKQALWLLEVTCPIVGLRVFRLTELRESEVGKATEAQKSGPTPTAKSLCVEFILVRQDPAT